jgi:hypothetical protein
MIICCFCNATVVDVEAAIEAGWYPSFYAGDEEFSEPLCPRCFASFMVVGDDSETELKSECRYLLTSPEFAKACR